MRVAAPALAVALLVACKSTKDEPPPRRGAPLVAIDGGLLRACFSEAACDALHPGDRCYFAQPHPVSSSGYCMRAEGACAVSRPFCSVSGKTVFACRYPAEPWTHQGECDEAGK